MAITLGAIDNTKSRPGVRDDNQAGAHSFQSLLDQRNLSWNRIRGLLEGGGAFKKQNVN